MQEASEIPAQSQWIDSIDRGGLLWYIQLLQSNGIMHTETFTTPSYLFFHT